MSAIQQIVDTLGPEWSYDRIQRVAFESQKKYYYALIDQPSHSPVEFAPRAAGNEISKGLSQKHLYGVLIYTRAIEENPIVCARCADPENRIFLKCVSLQGRAEGACAACVYVGKGPDCAMHIKQQTRNDPLPDMNNEPLAGPSERPFPHVDDPQHFDLDTDARSRSVNSQPIIISSAPPTSPGSRYTPSLRSVPTGNERRIHKVQTRRDRLASESHDNAVNGPDKASKAEHITLNSSIYKCLVGKFDYFAAMSSLTSEEQKSLEMPPGNTVEIGDYTILRFACEMDDYWKVRVDAARKVIYGVSAEENTG